MSALRTGYKLLSAVGEVAAAKRSYDQRSVRPYAQRKVSQAAHRGTQSAVRALFRALFGGHR